MKEPVDEFRYRSPGQPARNCELAGRGLSGAKEFSKYHPFRNGHPSIREFAGKAMRNVIGNKPKPEAGMAFEAAYGLRAFGLHSIIIVS